MIFPPGAPKGCSPGVGFAGTGSEEIAPEFAGLLADPAALFVNLVHPSF